MNYIESTLHKFRDAKINQRLRTLRFDGNTAKAMLLQTIDHMLKEAAELHALISHVLVNERPDAHLRKRLERDLAETQHFIMDVHHKRVMLLAMNVSTSTAPKRNRFQPSSTAKRTTHKKQRHM